MNAIARPLVTEHATDRVAPDFRALVEEHKRGVYWLALDLTGNHDDAEDLSQEVFIKAFRGLAGFRGDSSAMTWLRRIAVNTFLNSRRRRPLSVVRLDDDESTLELASGPDAPQEAPIAGRQIQSEIDSALERLSARERTAFVLRHYQELPVREVAVMMDVAEGTVKSYLFRSTQKLQGLLAHLKTELQA